MILSEWDASSRGLRREQCRLGNMGPSRHLAVPLLPREALPLLLLLCCMVFSSKAESK